MSLPPSLKKFAYFNELIVIIDKAEKNEFHMGQFCYDAELVHPVPPRLSLRTPR